MTILFNGQRTLQAGPFESAVLPIPGGIKQAGVPLRLRLSLEAEPFPNGTTKLTAFLSLDGGATFRSASMTCVMPATFRGPTPHFWTMEFTLGANDSPTHAKFSSEAPSAFSTTVTLEAL